MEWIIIWTLAIWVPVPCPDSGPDEFGRGSNWSCAVNHGDYDYEKHSKIFTDEEKALAFLERCNERIGGCKLKEIK